MGITFIYGALRSGSTVFRLMLHAHPGIDNPGEYDYLFDPIFNDVDGVWKMDVDRLRRERGFRYSRLTLPDGVAGPTAEAGPLLEAFLDQLKARGAPDAAFSINLHRHLDVALALFPAAKVIHLVRDPRDVARSCIGMGWAGDVWHGVDPWLETERGWDRVAAQIPAERLLTIHYEALISDFEAGLREVCAFFDRPFVDGMLTYYEGTSYEAPDPTLIQQWRGKLSAYQAGLVEGKVGAMLTARGYAPGPSGPVHPGAIERLMLKLFNKRAKWAVERERHGLRLMLQERIGRKLGIRALHDPAVLAMQDQIQRGLR